MLPAPTSNVYLYHAHCNFVYIQLLKRTNGAAFGDIQTKHVSILQNNNESVVISLKLIPGSV